MHSLRFELLGSIEVTRLTDRFAVELEGDLAMSGCEAQALLKAIGVEEIPVLLGRDELLDQYDSTDLLDYICNNNDIDLDWFIKELTEANKDPADEQN